MTREQYQAQTVSAKRELKQLKEETKKLKTELDRAVSDYKLALGYESTVQAMCQAPTSTQKTAPSGAGDIVPSAF